MAEKKTDRRTLKTRRAVFEGLAALLAEKELRNITVQELSDKVDIHRVTFYKHFMDIYDVYEQLEKAILSNLGLLITEYGSKTTIEFYGVVFKYIKENPVYFKMICSPHSSSTLYWKVQKMVEGLNRVIWAERFDLDMNDQRVGCAIHYHSNGCLAIIADWVLSDLAQPEEFIAGMLSGLDMSTQGYLKTLLKK